MLRIIASASSLSIITFPRVGRTTLLFSETELYLGGELLASRREFLAFSRHVLLVCHLGCLVVDFADAGHIDILTFSEKIHLMVMYRDIVSWNGFTPI